MSLLLLQGHDVDVLLKDGVRLVGMLSSARPVNSIVVRFPVFTVRRLDSVVEGEVGRHAEHHQFHLLACPPRTRALQPDDAPHAKKVDGGCYTVAFDELVQIVARNVKEDAPGGGGGFTDAEIAQRSAGLVNRELQRPDWLTDVDSATLDAEARAALSGGGEETGQSHAQRGRASLECVAVPWRHVHPQTRQVLIAARPARGCTMQNTACVRQGGGAL